MRATLSFQLPQEAEEHERALKGSLYAIAIDEISNKIFRPYRKHGYSNEKLRKLHEENPCISKFMELLEREFYDILKDYEIG